MVTTMMYHRTETGCLNLTFALERPTIDTWEWFEFSPHVEVELLPQDGDVDDLFELCIIVSLIPEADNSTWCQE